MTGALLILVLLVLVGMLLWAFDRRARRGGAHAPHADQSDLRSQGGRGRPPSRRPPSGDSLCCGGHALCEKTSLTPLDTEPEYYDDHELDRLAGRDPLSYTAAETEEFRDILLTMRPDEAAGWSRSLQLRGIELPPEVRDELLMIVAELRAGTPADKPTE